MRALSRAVAALRTNLVDSGLGFKVYEGGFCREGEDSREYKSTANKNGVVTMLSREVNKTLVGVLHFLASPRKKCHLCIFTLRNFMPNFMRK